MGVFYVFQGETYQQEHDGGYVWSPKLNKNGGRNAGYTMMTNIRKGDFIFHNSNGKIVAISVAQTDCYDANQPRELKVADTEWEWDDDGYRIDTDYIELDNPIVMSNHVNWLKQHHHDDSAFTIAGRGKQQYMCRLHQEHAIYLLDKIERLQRSSAIKGRITDVKNNVVANRRAVITGTTVKPAADVSKILDQNANNPDFVESLTDGALKAAAENRGKRTPAERTVTTTQKDRDPYVSEHVKRRTKGICDLCNNPAPFKDKKGKPYLESHHVKWLADGGEDTIENAVGLCPNCHKKMHVVNDPADVRALMNALAYYKRKGL